MEPQNPRATGGRHHEFSCRPVGRSETEPAKPGTGAARFQDAAFGRDARPDAGKPAGAFSFTSRTAGKLGFFESPGTGKTTPDPHAGAVAKCISGAIERTGTAGD